jgi:aminomuconate-semialdehyde/2-hydroxymuconate-6-semialdehyde dehydrogenase
MTLSLRHYIDGSFVASAEGHTWDDPEPARGRTLAVVARGSAADVDAAAAAATRALTGPWRDTTPRERADLLDRIASGIEDRFDAFAEAESRDTGKPVTLARNVDVPRTIANFRFFAGAIRHAEDGFHDMGGAFNYTLRKPVGVFGLITPWNLPAYLASWKIAPALAMGNAVVVKPSEITPYTASLIAEVIDDVGLPPGVFNLVHGFGAEVGQALVEHDQVQGISFTGGTATGQIVGRTAASRFKKLSLELGGKNPSVVFADADFDQAVAGVTRAAFANQGQICLCGSRILVERPLHDRLVEALVERANGLVIGDPLDPATEFGSLVSLAHRDKVAGYVELGRQEGGEVVAGGGVPDLPGELAGGAYYRPTVITGLAHDSRTATEEIFGPVVTVHPFDDEDEAVAIANEVRYGLAGSVWTSNLGRAHRVSRELDSGMVWVNCWLLRDLRVPFGGMKDSGVGREGGWNSLDFYSESRNVCVQL